MISIRQKEKDYIVDAGSRVESKHGGSEDVSEYILAPGNVVIVSYLKNPDELIQRMKYINDSTRRVETWDGTGPR